MTPVLPPSRVVVFEVADRLARLEKLWDEQTAGLWRDYVSTFPIGSEADKVSNTNTVLEHAEQFPLAKIYTRKNLVWVNHLHWSIHALARDQFDNAIRSIFHEHKIDWRRNFTNANTADERERRTRHLDKWVAQFAWFDPERGPRVAHGLLAQLKILSVDEVVEALVPHGSLPSGDHLWMKGSDWHSGDYGIVNLLAKRLTASTLREVREWSWNVESKVTLYGDGAWSGGKTERRLGCMFLRCAKKQRHLDEAADLTLRVARITDKGRQRLCREITAIAEYFATTAGKKPNIAVSFPKEGLLSVKDPESDIKGLAFHNKHFRRYVDADDLGSAQKLCARIGKKLRNKSPLGTAEIASTIAFPFSNPNAMLPVLIDKAEVVLESGEIKTWYPLLVSRHNESTKQETEESDYYCNVNCPMHAKHKGTGELKENRGIVPWESFRVAP